MSTHNSFVIYILCQVTLLLLVVGLAALALAAPKDILDYESKQGEHEQEVRHDILDYESKQGEHEQKVQSS